MKYTFTLLDGREAVVRFKHHGKSKNKVPGAPGKPPKSTRCRIMVGEEVLGEAWARPAKEIYMLPASMMWLEEMIKNPRFIRCIRLENGNQKIVVLRGDQFCRREGRTESFRKALESVDISPGEKYKFIAEMIEQGAVKS